MKSKTVPKAFLKLVPFVAVFLLFCTNIYAQKVNINFKETSLKVILKEISRQTDFDFVYSNALTAINDKVSINYSANGEPIEKLFNLLFNERGISYKINKKQVTLAPSNIVPDKKALEGVSPQNMTQQVSSQSPLMVKGKVLDDVKSPIPGVTILNVTSGKGSFTDNNGNYTIEAKEGDQLRFMSIGMKNKEILVSRGQAIYNIDLMPDNIQLSEVVVTGFQSISKERVTGAVKTVRIDQLEKPTTNIAQRLIGTAAGVQATLDVDGNPNF